MEIVKPDKEILDIPLDGFSRVAYHPTDNLLLASSWDGSVSLYNTVNLGLVNRNAGNAALLDTCFAGPENFVAGGLERHVSYFNVTRTESRVLGDHDDAIRCLRFSNSLGIIVSGSWDRTVRMWDPRASTHWIGTTSVGGKVYAMGLSDSNNYLVISTDKTDLSLFDLRNMSEVIERKESPLKYQTRCIEINPNGINYAVGSIEGRVGIQYFNPAPEMQAKTYAFKCHRKEDMGSVVVYPVNCIAYNSSNGYFATGGSDSFVNLWDGENKKRIWKLKQYPSAIASLAFSGNGKQLAIACSYMYEEGDIPNQPLVKLFIKDL